MEIEPTTRTSMERSLMDRDRDGQLYLEARRVHAAQTLLLRPHSDLDLEHDQDLDHDHRTSFLSTITPPSSSPSSAASSLFREPIQATARSRPSAPSPSSSLHPPQPTATRPMLHKASSPMLSSGHQSKTPKSSGSTSPHPLQGIVPLIRKARSRATNVGGGTSKADKKDAPVDQALLPISPSSLEYQLTAHLLNYSLRPLPSSTSTSTSTPTTAVTVTTPTGALTTPTIVTSTADTAAKSMPAVVVSERPSIVKKSRPRSRTSPRQLRAPSRGADSDVPAAPGHLNVRRHRRSWSDNNMRVSARHWSNATASRAANHADGIPALPFHAHAARGVPVRADLQAIVWDRPLPFQSTRAGSSTPHSPTTLQLPLQLSTPGAPFGQAVRRGSLPCRSDEGAVLDGANTAVNPDVAPPVPRHAIPSSNESSSSVQMPHYPSSLHDTNGADYTSDSSPFNHLGESETGVPELPQASIATLYPYPRTEQSLSGPTQDGASPAMAYPSTMASMLPVTLVFPKGLINGAGTGLLSDPSASRGQPKPVPYFREAFSGERTTMISVPSSTNTSRDLENVVDGISGRMRSTCISLDPWTGDGSSNEKPLPHVQREKGNRYWVFFDHGKVVPGPILFLFGHLCPPLWWIGCVYPRLEDPTETRTSAAPTPTAHPPEDPSRFQQWLQQRLGAATVGSGHLIRWGRNNSVSLVDSSSFSQPGETEPDPSALECWPRDHYHTDSQLYNKTPMVLKPETARHEDPSQPQTVLDVQGGPWATEDQRLALFEQRLKRDLMTMRYELDLRWRRVNMIWTIGSFIIAIIVTAFVIGYA
ncbi:hypothetical protein BGW38_005597 [Lunasporangiospora selenospora]|uniref:Uncharacterized protein n=1 Tax=Lunasporangiospora selenospora TaxID=979761 RepID=A0A9P6KBD2_9FUNG|nr:hypothetical protein BGW38_005597 [Lunasporangiospora selenospora]